MTTFHTRRFFAVAAAAGLLAAGACSSDRPVECNTHSDCAARGPLYTCAVHNCVKLDGCQTDAECIAANGGKPFLCDLSVLACRPGCKDRPDGGKTANQQCSDAFGPTFICSNARCVEGCRPTAPQQCVEMYGPAAVCKDEKCVPGQVEARDAGTD